MACNVVVAVSRMAQQHPRSRASVRRAVSSDAAFLGSLPRARQQNGLPILASVRVDILGLINAKRSGSFHEPFESPDGPGKRE